MNKLKQQGISLIELMFFIAVAIMLFAGAAPLLFGSSSTISRGYNGTIEMRCSDGYKFVISENGHARQMFDDKGNGIRCDSTGL